MKEFVFPLQMDAENLIRQAKETVERYGGHWQGDESSGRFSGQGLEGEYRIDDQKLHLWIVKKPFFLSWSMIDSALNQLFFGKSA